MNELEHLLQLKQQNPTDDTILSKLAFYYLKNSDGNKELDYFKQAYELNPSIKNTHNYAFWVYYEYGQDELAQPLFQEIMTKNPKSFYPYMAYANLLFFKYNALTKQQTIDKYLPILLACGQNSVKLYPNTPRNYQKNYYYEYAWLCNNLANIYVMAQDYQQAEHYYQLAYNHLSVYIQEIENDVIYFNEIDEIKYHVLLNQVRLNILKNDISTAQQVLDLAIQNDYCDKLEIANLYALMGNYQTCYDIIHQEYIDLSWEWIWFALRQIDISLWEHKLIDEINQYQQAILESQQELLSANEQDKSEIQETMEHYQNYLNKLKIWQHQPPLPSHTIQQECLLCLKHFSRCWLFGCEHCNNLVDDE